MAPPMDRGRRSVMERLMPVLGRLPARWRMMLRAILRNRRRTAFTAVGVAVSVILVMVFAGMRDTLPGMVDRQFGQIERQDGEVVVSGPVDAVLGKLRADRDIAAAEAYSSYGVTVSSGAHRYETYAGRVGAADPNAHVPSPIGSRPTARRRGSTRGRPARHAVSQVGGPASRSWCRSQGSDSPSEWRDSSTNRSHRLCTSR